jgi:hypothetical protein
MNYAFIKCIKLEKPISDKELVKIVLKSLKGIKNEQKNTAIRTR